MITVYNKNLLIKLYGDLSRALDFHLKGIKTYEPFKPIDAMMRLILLNNGCSELEGHEDDDNMQICKIIKEKYYVVFLRNWMGNEVNEVFDAIEFFGVTYLVVFLDYFNDLSKPMPAENDESIKANLKRSMGYAVYYDAICKIVKVFELLFFNPAWTTQDMAATSMANNMRYAPSLIAIKILDKYHPIQEADIPDIPIDQARDYIKIPLELLLSGVRSIDSVRELGLIND